MNALSLFSGIGGLDLAAEWAGFKTVAFCECDPFCQKVLAKHWPGVKIYDDVRTIDTSELPAIELLHGGYPCQPFSTAGNRRGEADERHMWPHMLRVVRELKPRCYRTVKSMHPAAPAIQRTGTHHNALDDAINQANHLIAMLSASKGGAA